MSIVENPDAVVGGVDTHVDMHMAAVVNHIGHEVDDRPASRSVVPRPQFHVHPQMLVRRDQGGPSRGRPRARDYATAGP
jgi:hypothetical protein